MYRHLSKLEVVGFDKNGVSHFLYFLNTTHSDPLFTSTVDGEDPVVIHKLEISNTYISNGCPFRQVSRDYV